MSLLLHDLHPLAFGITDSLLRSIVKHEHEFFLLDASAYSDAHFGQGTGPILLGDVACVGNDPYTMLHFLNELLQKLHLATHRECVWSFCQHGSAM